MPRNLPEWVLTARQELAHRIAQLRREAGHPQDRFAQHIGLDRRTYQRIEAGTADPTYGALLLIAAGLDLTVPELVDTPPPTPPKE
ncbi:helix-turn-helix domain-containing protein [Streptomyces hydrogenans]|uniref:helix-turn-helix domain-containing protein n=1 Tax=Streptomyces hydrogenans TaxID=1873719 RepID=UPI003683BB68